MTDTATGEKESQTSVPGRHGTATAHATPQHELRSYATPQQAHGPFPNSLQSFHYDSSGGLTALRGHQGCRVAEWRCGPRLAPERSSLTSASPEWSSAVVCTAPAAKGTRRTHTGTPNAGIDTPNTHDITRQDKAITAGHACDHYSSSSNSNNNTK